MKYRLDWSGAECPGGRHFRVLTEDGTVLGEYEEVIITAPGRLVNYQGGGVLEAEGAFVSFGGHAEVRGEP